MAILDRTTVLRGPAHIVRDSVTFHAQAAITAEPNLTRFQIETSRSGKVDERALDATWPVKFVPTGEINADILAALFPAAYLNPVIGTSIFPSTDKTLVVTGITHTTGNVFTLKSSALTRMPNLVLAANKTLFGEAEFTGIRQKSTAWSTAGSLTGISDQGSPAAGDSDPADIPSEPATAAWGSIIADIETEAGWTIEPTLELKPEVSDREGTYDMTLVGVGYMAKCRPLGPSMATIQNAMAHQGTSAARGASLRPLSADLTLETTTLTATVKNAALVSAGFRWGANELRIGEIGFVAQRNYDAGAYGALFEIALN